MSNLKGKVALITGSSKGIGAQIAKTFAEKGAKVVVNYSGSKAEAKQVVSTILKANGEAICIQADVSKTEDVNQLFAQSIAHFGKIDILVNNAGVMLNSLISEASDAVFEQQIQINLKGVFNTLREASTKLTNNGSVINISSTVTRTNFPTYGIYSATKAAVEQLSKVFAKEVGHRGINVNCVLPGPTGTDLFLQGKSETVINQLASNNAFKRLATPSDIANIVVQLATNEFKWMSAQSVGANGGMA